MLRTAAMEPADQRREHGRFPRYSTRGTQGRNGARRPAAGAHGNVPILFTAFMKPQWSPPTSGGSTRARRPDRPRTELAAMEPADQRREHYNVATGETFRRS